MRRFAASALVLASLALLGAAPPVPRALQGVAPGLWEVSRSAAGLDPRRICLAEVASLTEIEHRGERCSRSVLTDRPGFLVVYNECQRGDFARSTMQVVTPRSLKLETTGIHRGEPFAYRLYARRIGACPRTPARR